MTWQTAVAVTLLILISPIQTSALSDHSKPSISECLMTFDAVWLREGKFSSQIEQYKWFMKHVGQITSEHKIPLMHIELDVFNSSEVTFQFHSDCHYRERYSQIIAQDLSNTSVLELTQTADSYSLDDRVVSGESWREGDIDQLADRLNGTTLAPGCDFYLLMSPSSDLLDNIIRHMNKYKFPVIISDITELDRNISLSISFIRHCDQHHLFLQDIRSTFPGAKLAWNTNKESTN